MAELKKVMKLDQKLIEMGILDPTIDKDYKKVHSMLNTHVRKNGKILTDETFKKGDEALRKWLMLLYKKCASQEKLTSFLSCGLSHLSFVFIESGFSKIELDDLIARALKSFKNRKYNKSFFKVSSAEMKALASRKNNVKKKATTKASSTKKTKPSAKAVKKPAAKKNTANQKKAAVKKNVLKVKAAKKKAPKAKAVKKKTPKVKAVAKKVSKAKEPVKKISMKKGSKIKSILSKFFE